MNIQEAIDNYDYEISYNYDETEEIIDASFDHAFGHESNIYTQIIYEGENIYTFKEPYNEITQKQVFEILDYSMPIYEDWDGLDYAITDGVLTVSFELYKVKE